MRIPPIIRELVERARRQPGVKSASDAPRTASGDTSGLERAVVDGRPLRLLMATARYLPGRGGTEIHTHQVAQRLAAHGAEVTVLSTADEKSFVRESTDGQVRVVLVRAWPPQRDYYLAPEVVRIVRGGETDIVHCQGYHTLVAPLVMLAAASARIPYVVSLHSGGHSSRLRRSIRPVQALVLRPLLYRAAQLIASSPFEAELFARRTRLPLSSFLVVPSGVDLPLTAPEEPADEAPLLLSIGRLESYKGHHRIVAALPELERLRPGIRLRIVGTGPDEQKLHSLAERLGVGHMLEIAPVPADRRDEMARLLRRAACVVMLSEYESQGLAIQEALALGRPLVVSDNSALSDLGRHANVRTVGRDATSDDITAAIVELLDAPPVEAPEMFTWDQCAAALLDVYLKTLAVRR
jgi:glycosyltransferase involved in cell wall biosynthesis